MPQYKTGIHVAGGAWLAILATACAPVASPPSAASGVPLATEQVAGWYIQDGSASRLQPCNASEVLTIVDGGALRRQAADFGLQDGDPVYVRLGGARAGPSFRVSRVEQFGSPQPIRDCRMTGTMIQQ